MRSGRLPGAMVAATSLAWAALLPAGCGGDYRFEPPDRGEQVAAAESLFASVEFDTITWASPEARDLEGNVVYSSKCRTCHGPLGEGGTEYARQRQLDVPSLVLPDWQYANDLAGIRRRIFIGHVAGMPTYGVAGITPREIDAAAHYVIERLRPDVLGGGG